MPILPRIKRPAIEFNVVEHCNLRCANCDHDSPALPERLASIVDFSHDMTALHEVLEAKELKLLGGEPLLHPAIDAFAETAKAIGIGHQVTLVTNGLLLKSMSDRLWNAIDRLQISKYPGVRLPIADSEIRARARKHGVDVGIENVSAFRLTLLAQPVESPSWAHKVFRNCSMARHWSCHTVLDGRYYKCAPSALLESRLRQSNRLMGNREDGVALHDNPNLRQDLERYLKSKEPLQACSWCLGTSGKTMPHRQLRREEVHAEEECDVPSESLLEARLDRRLGAHISGIGGGLRTFLRSARD